MPNANDQTTPTTDNTKPEGGGKSDATAKAADGAALAEANKRISELTSKLTDATAKAATLEGELTTVKGERDTAVTRVTELTEEVSRLAAAAAEKGAPPKLDLPKNARQLNESVTIADANGMRRDAKLGDVVMVSKATGDKLVAEVAELQATVGRNYRVYAVSPATLEDLAQLKHLR